VPKRKKDLLLVKGPTDDGAGVHVVRARPERLELGTMRPLQEGRPIDGEVVRVNPHPECPFLYEVETEFSTQSSEASAATTTAEEPKPPAAKASAPARGAGPPKVASEAYRRNWDAIWNRQSRRGPVLN
jgi:hypothetical protein